MINGSLSASGKKGAVGGPAHYGDDFAPLPTEKAKPSPQRNALQTGKPHSNWNGKAPRPNERHPTKGTFK
jgi:hypothetical protein